MAVRNVSELRHRVSLQRPTEPVYDDSGFPVAPDGAWEAVKSVWALARDVSGKEFFEAHATQALDVLVFEMRATNLPMDSSWSIMFRGERYYVLHINHRDYKGIWWEVRTSRTKPERRDAFVSTDGG